MKDISVKLTKAVEKFESKYKGTLDKASIDDEVYNVLYLLGADIKHLFDDVINIIDEN